MKRNTTSERALVLAPKGRDAAIAAAILGEADLTGDTCRSLAEMIAQLDRGAGFVVVTEEALTTADLTPLSDWLGEQEEWSDLPFVLLTNRGGGIERNPAARRYLDVLGNVTFLERPFHPTTLVSLARSAVRSRRRQYEARARLEALRESEARNVAALRIARLGTFDWNLVDHEITLDERSREILGVGSAQRDRTEGSHPLAEATFQSLRDVVMDAAALGSRLETQLEIDLPGGERRTVSSLGDVARDSDGQVRRIVGVFADATERVQAEEAARAERERQRLMLHQMPGFAALLAGREHRFLYVNDAYVAIAGQRDFIGRTVPDVFPELVGQGYFELLDQVFETGKPFAARAMQVRLGPYGDEHFVDLVYQPIRDDVGQVTGIFVGGYDITEMVRAQRALSESELRYRTLFGAIDVGFCIVEMKFDEAMRPVDYRFVEANPAFERQTGLVGAEGRWATEAAPGLERHWFETYGGVALTGTAIRFENEAVPLGRWFDVHAYRTGGASEHRVAILFNDITARRHAEIAVRELNETLEARVAERGAELAEAQEALRQSQKMEAVGQLTGGVAHDFNNLLTIIRSSADLLRRPNLTEERRRRYVDAIAGTVDRAAKLTGQLLAFARRQALKPEAFDVAERIGSVMDMLRSVVGSRVTLVTDIDCPLCFVEADVSQFETALVNLAVNARDAMGGEGTLTVSVRNVTGMPALGSRGDETPFVAMSVSDTGSGIPPDKLSQIFEPFFTTKEIGKGTGLGLSQVYGFLKQSGGDVAVESELGRGTTFTVYLPRVDSVSDHRDDHAQGGALPVAGFGRRVLVVEDNADVGRFSTQLLQDLGYVTTWAANGLEALEILDGTGTFDVVFSDVVMPGMGGVDLGHEIRRRHPDLPVVLTSGYSEILADEGLQGFELLHKPYAAEELSRVLRQATGTAQPSSRVRTAAAEERG